MKINVEKMLEYQASDQVIYKAEQAFASSSESKRYSQILSKLNELKTVVIKSDKEAADIRKDIEKRETQLGESGRDLEKRAAAMTGEKSAEEIASNEDALRQMEESLDRAEKEFARSVKRLEEIEREAKHALIEIKQCSADLEKSKAVLQKKRSEMQAELSDEVKRRKELQAELRPEELEIYKKVRKENIRLPIVVEYVSGTCRGCGMHVEHDLRGKLNESGDAAECPNCHRILYIK